MNIASIAGLSKHPGPFLSTYMDVSRDTEDARHRIELAWRAARERYLDSGATERLVDLTEERVLTPASAPGQASRMIVASGDEVLVDDVVRRSDGAQVLAWGPLPDLTSWLSDRDMMMPVLLVVADRLGAEFEFYDSWPGHPSLKDSIDGDTLHVTKVPDGDWAQKEYQRRSENVWRRNAEDVAAKIDKLADRGPRVVALAGDVRAVTDIKDAVGEPVRSRLAVLEHGGRAAGSSRQSLEHAVDQAVRDVVVREHLELAHELEQDAGQGRAAAFGIPDVLESLIQGRVRTLLLAPGAAAANTVPTVEYPGLPLPAGALEHPRLRADLVTVCAAAATGADVVMLGPASLPDDGVAAILRWD